MLGILSDAKTVRSFVTQVTMALAANGSEVCHENYLFDSYA